MSEPWSQLLREPALIEAAARIDVNDAGAIARLRKTWPADLVRCAIELAEARRKAADKFPAFADRIVADASGMEQATSLDIAEHKARRFAEAKFEHVVDLCCGIGGDAMALAGHADVRLVDSDADRVWMAQHNVRAVTGRACAAAAADVTTLELRGTPFHIDPARRQGSRRLIAFEDMQPGPAYLRQLLDRNPDGAIKLSPGIDFDGLPHGEVEVINRHGRLVQAVLWCGKLSRGDTLRTATQFTGAGGRGLGCHGSESSRPRDSETCGKTPLGCGGPQTSGTQLPEGLPVATITGDSATPLPFAVPGRFLLAVDPAIERAGLMGVAARQLGVAAVHSQLGLFTADHNVQSPWLTGFELLEEMPWRVKKVKQWLDAHGGGIIEVKTRGGAVDPDTVQRELRGEGDTPYTVFILRHDRRVLAWITRRL